MQKEAWTPCSKCHMRFPRKDVLRDHVKRVHQVSNNLISRFFLFGKILFRFHDFFFREVKVNVWFVMKCFGLMPYSDNIGKNVWPNG